MNTRYRADLPAWIFIGGLSCLPWLIVWLNWWRKIDVPALMFAVSSSGLAFAWLFSFRITLTPSEVRFRSRFSGQQSIRLEQIQRVRLAWTLRRGMRGPLRLVIEPRPGSAVRELDINAKVFSREAVAAVLELGSRVAESDDGGLRDGVVMKELKKWKRPHNV
jgi:hypothetical protein